jgi:SAM-dependent methyltransferase
MYSYDGFCPCCEKDVTFTTAELWYRDHLLCPICNSNVRERALALVLQQVAPAWRTLRIHESSPGEREISMKFRSQAPGYVASHFFPTSPKGEYIGYFRNEDLENQTFHDESFDLVISLDVMEHVFNPEMVYREVYRTLRSGGSYIHTFPIRKHQTEAAVRRAEHNSDGSIRHLVETPEYHGNPIDASGSLVTFDYGYDIARQIAEWASFDVRVSRFWDRRHGIIGEYTEVIECRKS